ncbi:MAG TPA: alpha/beta hydrolase, partial [Pirellulaceae bacterium]|nr:alpha/beta hydrolase [Pirellulaceae bacterium]
MDRRVLLGCAVLLAAMVGCAKEGKPPDTAGSPATHADARSPGEGGGAAQTHRPVIVGPETKSTTIEFPDDVVEGDLIRPPVDFQPAPETAGPLSAEPPVVAPRSLSNPLRTSDVPREAPNPLRSFSTLPQMAEPREAAAPQFAPSAAPFAPMSIEPSAGTAAGGSDAEAAQRAAEAALAEARRAMEAEAAAKAAAEEGALRARATELAPSRETTQPTEPAQPFDVVQVFYGTDRAAIEPQAGGIAAHVMRFLPTAFCALVTLCLVLIASSRKSVALWSLAIVGTAACIGLGYQATAGTLFAIRWEGKLGPQYTVDRAPGGEVQLGVCEISIPKIHKPGELEAPSILRLEVREDAAQHVVLTKTERLADEKFYALLRERVQASPRRELFVFIHGFDTQFEDAARRTAQIHHDLKFQGAPIFFSWPANNKSVLTYPADENTIGWSAPHFKQFLLSIVKESGAQSINLIAHSMGNRALSVALREIDLEFRGQSRLFNQVVLAAPDIDADDFRTNIAPAMQHTANHVTLYASSRDDALRVSQLLHRGARAGDSGRGLVVLPGMDTIDVTAIDTSPWGHIYLGASDPVLQDLKHLFLYGFPPQERRWLSPAQREGLTYWIFEATQT